LSPRSPQTVPDETENGDVPSGGTLEQLTSAIGAALAALSDDLQPDRIADLLVELGLDDPIDLSGDPQFQQTLASGVDALEELFPKLDALADAIDGGDIELTIDAAADARTTLATVIASLEALATDLRRAAAATSLADEAASLADVLVARLLGYALICALERSRPALLGLLEILTVAERTATQVGSGTTARTVLRRRFHYDRLLQLVSDVPSLLQDGYGWGTQHLLFDLLLERIARFLLAIGVITGDALDDNGNPVSGLDLFALTIGARTDISPAGLGATMTASAADSVTISLYHPSPGWHLELDLTGAFAEGLVFLLTPPAKLQSPATSVPVPGGAHFVLTGAVPDAADPLVLVGIAGGSRIEAATVRVSVGATMSGTSTGAMTNGEVGADVVATCDVSGGSLVLSLSGADSFLSDVLPGELRCAFDLGLTWSADRGFAFRGAAGLEATVPVALSFGSVSVFAIHLSIHAHDTGITAEISADVSTAIGPVRVAVDRLGAAAALTFPDGGNLGLADLRVGFKPPSGLALTVDAGPVTGGGTLVFDPDRGLYAGEMQLQFEQIAVRAVGLLTTGRSGYSLLVLVSAQFPPVQLGLGFMLVGVGGLLGIHRTVAVEALRAGLKAGSLGAVLSPPDPNANPAQLVASLAGLFPPAAGRHVFAPTARIVWGSPVLITIDLALVLELPSPVRLVALGRMRALLPEERDPVVRLQVDVLGVIDFDQQTAAVDATLIDSRIAQFALTGDLALRMSWGPAPVFLLAVGGFHPRFAAPPGFPALERVAVALASGDNPKLRLEAYLALTSNTVQFGARVDVGARAGSFSIGGFMAFDALVTLSPLAFEADIAAKLAVKAGSHTLLSISLALTLSGPRPWHAHGRASFSILFFDVSFGFDVTIGDPAPAALPNPVDVAPLLLAALADPRAWTAQLPAGAAVVTLRTLEPGQAILAHPLATLQVRQRVAPLDRTLDRFGTSVPSGAARFRITSATVGGVRTTLTPLQDRFAAAQFTVMSDDQKLSAPSFEAMTSGAALGADGYAAGAPVTVSVIYEQALVTAEGITPPSHQRLPLPLDVFATLTATTSVPAAPAFALRDTA
jgi:hypothetical protein